jgi:AcrR family transcriptional regulator
MATPTKAVSAPRKPGRPPADGIDQRERLLDAALASFAELGIAATSLRALAHDNGVTPAMLHYYFRSRERLVETVIAERLLPVMAELKLRLTDKAVPDARDLIREFVVAMYGVIERHPWLPALWVREVLPDSGELRGTFIERIGPELPQPLARRFSQAQADGQLPPGIEPRLLVVSLIGLIMVPFAAAPMWRRVFSAEDIDTARMLEHTLTMLTAGIAA